MKRIRVAHLITNFKLGGAQDYLLQIVKGLDRTVFEPIVAGRLEGEWVPLIRSLEGIRSHDIPSLRREISPVNDARAILEVRQLCRELNVDVLHTHSSKAGVVGRLAAAAAGRCAVVHTVHGFSFNDFMPAWQKGFYVSLERAMSRFTTSLLVYSNGDFETARALGIGAQRSIEKFYYGIDFAPFAQPCDRREVRQSLGYQDDHRVFGFTGRFSEQKGLRFLLKAFAGVYARFPQARLLLVGDGPLRDELLAMADDLKIADAVQLTGFRSDVAAMLAAMDVFVMTSLWEGLSRSLAEAMYARLPVIATDVGGTRDAVRNGETGWLIPAADVQAAIHAMSESLADPARAGAFADAGYRWAREAFDVDATNRKIAALYASLYAERESTTRGQEG